MRSSGKEGGGRAHLGFPTPVVHHVVLCRHLGGAVELRGVELGLLDLGDSVGDVDLPEALALVLLPPAREELPEDGCFPSLRENLDLLVGREIHMGFGLPSCLAISGYKREILHVHVVKRSWAKNSTLLREKSKEKLEH